jgi:hypothetical protein
MSSSALEKYQIWRLSLTPLHKAVLFYQGVTWANTQGNCVALYNSVSNYLSANNYANTNAILQGIVVGLIVTVPQFYINAKLENTEVATTNGTCIGS